MKCQNIFKIYKVDKKERCNGSAIIKIENKWLCEECYFAYKMEKNDV